MMGVSKDSEREKVHGGTGVTSYNPSVGRGKSGSTLFIVVVLYLQRLKKK